MERCPIAPSISKTSRLTKLPMVDGLSLMQSISFGNSENPPSTTDKKREGRRRRECCNVGALEGGGGGAREVQYSGME